MHFKYAHSHTKTFADITCTSTIDAELCEKDQLETSLCCHFFVLCVIVHEFLV